MRSPVLLTLLVTRVTQAYVWPSPKLDSLESLRFDLDRRGAVGFLNPCDVFIFGDGSGPSGRSDAADWIRTVSKAHVACPPESAAPYTYPVL
jgi:hypothetical protein